jgi:hypothetical protein
VKAEPILVCARGLGRARHQAELRKANNENTLAAPLVMTDPKELLILKFHSVRNECAAPARKGEAGNEQMTKRISQSRKGWATSNSVAPHGSGQWLRIHLSL